MNAYQSARYHDLLERMAKQTLSPDEQRRFNELDAQAREEWENKPAPQWLGGDYPDVF